MNPEDIHASLVSSGYEVPSLEDFTSLITSDSSFIKDVHTSLVNNGYEIPELDVFQSQLIPTRGTDPNNLAGDKGFRNANPGNIKDAITGEFIKFNSIEEGFAAMVDDIGKKQQGNTRTGLTAESSVSDLINTWAPVGEENSCLLYTSPSPRDQRGSRMPSSA